jgi:hypothetical protein
VASIFQGNMAAMAASGLMDLSVGMMPLFSAGAVQSSLGSGQSPPCLCEPAPTVHGGLSHAEGHIHPSDRGLLYT